MPSAWNHPPQERWGFQKQEENAGGSPTEAWAEVLERLIGNCSPVKTVLPADLSLPTVTDGLPEGALKALLSAALLRAYRQERSLGRHPFLPARRDYPHPTPLPTTLSLYVG